MSDEISAKDIREYMAYLKICTDRQVQGCYEKEKAAGREDYAALCEIEADNREIHLEN